MARFLAAIAVVLLAALAFADSAPEHDVVKVVLAPVNLTLYTGESAGFSVKLLDRYGNERQMQNGDEHACALSRDLGEVADAYWGGCRFTASKAGTGYVHFIYRQYYLGYSIMGSARINVLPAKCKIMPFTTMMSATQSRKFWVECTKNDGYTQLDCPAMTWGATGGTIARTAKVGSQYEMYYNASPYVGDYRVYATNSRTSDPDAVYCEQEIVVVSGQVSTLKIEPGKAITIYVGETAEFDAVAKDINGNAVPDAKINWKVEGSAGTINHMGTFTASEKGSSIVKAEASCPFMAAGCPTASVSVTVLEKEAPLASGGNPQQGGAQTGSAGQASAGREEQGGAGTRQSGQATSGVQTTTPVNEGGKQAVAQPQIDPVLAIAGGFALGVMVLGAMLLLTGQKRR